MTTDKIRNQRKTISALILKRDKAKGQKKLNLIRDIVDAQEKLTELLYPKMHKL